MGKTKKRPARMTELVGVRFTQREFQEVQEVADGYGCSVSEVLRRSFREAVWRQNYTASTTNSDGTGPALQGTPDAVASI